MSASVLYDAPGPRAKARNLLYSALFLVIAAAVVWWVLRKLADANQLDWVKWSPFFTDSRVWTTFLLPGLVNTLKAAALSMLIALPLGAILGIARLSDHAWVRWTAGTVVEFFRAIPVLLLMAFASAFYALYTNISSDMRPLYAVVTGLVLYNASVLAEVFRAGILSLPRGQTDAAKAIGMRKSQTMSHVLLPQSVTAMLPAIVSQLVVIVKDTALGGVMLGFAELLSKTRPIYGNYGANVIATLTIIALIFIVLNMLLTGSAGWLERRIRRGKRSSGAVLAPSLLSDVKPVGDAPGPDQPNPPHKPPAPGG
ncbi:amino acid ABC transporter permease [Streptomyces sp. ACA25]|uniref:amino acid ABC transporter permease n=1 Tax=Streptomyces sp. ACA25 TaxID=3022596 RepID=UPI0023079212|nr:amino acid ABC transporter permease [Streptomyces sp. ACA25]MDB1088852.1 amino acid ABC transporter permease [Streptomyces sp. ACA25]